MKDPRYPNNEILNIDTIDDFLSDMPVLYKYTTLENPISTLKNHHLWLVKPSIWDDPFEKRFINAKYEKTVGTTTTKDDFPFEDKVFATCLARDRSSEAQWNTYSKGSIGIKFTVMTQVLLEQLNVFATRNSSFKIYLGKVEYHKTEEIEKKQLSQLKFDDEDNGVIIKKDISRKDFCARLFLLKRRDFKYENEIRIIIFKDRKAKSKGMAFDYKCANFELFPSLMISPKVKKNTETMLKEYLKQFDMGPFTDSLGRMQPRITKCHLYDDEKIITINI